MNTKEIEKTTDNTVTEKPVEKKKTTPRVKKTELSVNGEKQKISKVEVIKESPIKTEMGKLESAYLDAISGKIKFKEVRSIFEKLHKEIKKSKREKK